jgi:hypothetical protein
MGHRTPAHTGAEKGKLRCVVESMRRMEITAQGISAEKGKLRCVEITGESGARAGERGRGEIGASMDPLSSREEGPYHVLYSTHVVLWTYILAAQHHTRFFFLSFSIDSCAHPEYVYTFFPDTLHH